MFTIEDVRARALKRLPRAVRDYLEGGAGEERGLTRNREALSRYLFSPRTLVNVAERDLSVEYLGKRRPLPFIIAPTGLANSMRAGADVMLAKVAASNGIPFILSTAATTRIEEVAEKAGGELWFQLYVMHRDLAASLVDRAARAGYDKLVLTVDVPVGGRRPRDERNGFVLPFRMSPRFALDCALHPAWAIDQLTGGMPQLANMASPDNSNVSAQAEMLRRKMDSSFDWEALEALRARWPRQLIVKGLSRREDVERCFAIGVDAVVLSNHGGRQLEDCPAPIDSLAAIEAPAGPLLVDSGFRSGADVAKALALGAGGVLLGRATLYGVAAGGEDGVQAVIDILKAELDNTLALLGCPRADALSRDVLVQRP